MPVWAKKLLRISHLTCLHNCVLENKKVLIQGRYTEKNSIKFEVDGETKSTYFNVEGTGEFL